jgi:REP element-mobilizing transposase RayT
MSIWSWRIYLDNISKIYNHIRIDKYVIMPNHIHMVLCIDNPARDDGRTMCAPTSVSRVIRHCKECVTKQIGFSMWQKSFNDRIIRDEAEYRRISQYIDENPARWTEDEYFNKEI